MEDIFSRFGDLFGGGGFDFGGFGGFGGGGGGRQVVRGSDLRARVRLTLEDIEKGVEKKLKIKKNVACSHCGGEGTSDPNGKQTCGTCHGTGAVVTSPATASSSRTSADTAPQVADGEPAVAHDDRVHSGEEAGS